MRADDLHNAITLLPEELLESADALRRKKRFPWKSVLTTAACVCLVLGLALGYGRLIAPASEENGAVGDDCATPMQEAVTQSQADTPSSVEVVQVEADHIFVVSAVANNSDSCALRAPIRLTFEKLEQAPALEVGQTIRIYWNTEDYDPIEHSIAPYRIEIPDE